jgi:hypothetical protein
MKKIFILTIISLSILCCNKDYVNKLPTTSNVVENFYKTPSDATEALTATYNMLTWDDWWGSMIISEIASDDCAGGGGTADGGGYQMYDRGLQQPGSNVNEPPWNTYYGGIYRANVYLQNEGKINWKGNESLQLQYQAEARFLRAYDHFYLARLFGEIPFLDHPLAPNEQLPARTPAAQLYGDILADLQFCAKNGLSAPYGAMNPNNWGRATKWAAEAMIVRVFLYYTGYYNQTDLQGFTAIDARNMIDDVILNSGHQLVPKYASLWRVPCISELDTIANYAGEMNSEVVWSITAVSNGGNYGANYMQRMIGPRGTNIDPYGQGWGAMTVLPSLWNLYDSTDTRRKATILNWAAEKLTYKYKAQQQAQYTGYSSKKYELVSIDKLPEDNSAGDWQFNGFEDFIVIRYADVLLMGAELYAITGGSNATATSYVNQVRERAYGNNLHDYSNVEISDIMKERQLELACEGIRYWDILRSCKGDFSKLVGILTYVDKDGGINANSTTDVTSLDVDGNNFVAKKGLFQLPQDQLDLMKGVIKQNPGYN